MRRRPLALAAAGLALAALAGLQLGHQRPAAAEEGPAPVPVEKAWIRFDDGDTVMIHWPKRASPETIRILGIDTPEVQHLEHDLPYDQPFGREASGFLRGCLAMANRVTLVRAKEPDPYGRTLGYLLLDGKNYSVLAVEARLAIESVSHFGDNGLPKEAKAVLAAAKRAGPTAFEAPFRYRRRMRDVTKWMKARGLYPAGPDPVDGPKAK